MLGTVPAMEEIVAVVYWKADLLHYQYILASFTQTGELIDQKAIGVLQVTGNKVRQSVTTLQEDGFIFVAEGMPNTPMVVRQILMPNPAIPTN